MRKCMRAYERVKESERGREREREKTCIDCKKKTVLGKAGELQVRPATRRHLILNRTQGERRQTGRLLSSTHVRI